METGYCATIGKWNCSHSYHFKSIWLHSRGCCCRSSLLWNRPGGFALFQAHPPLCPRSCGNSRLRKGGTSYRGSPGAELQGGILRSGTAGWRWGSGCCHPPASRLRSGPGAGTSRRRTADPLWPPRSRLERRPWSHPRSSPSWSVLGNTLCLRGMQSKREAGGFCSTQACETEEVNRANASRQNEAPETSWALRVDFSSFFRENVGIF